MNGEMLREQDLYNGEMPRSLRAPPSASLPMTMPTQSNNHQCRVELNRYSANGVVVDYQIVLAEDVTDVHEVVSKTEDLFEAICLFYVGHQWKARLIAQCEYARLNNEGEVTGKETYHHASYHTEWCSILGAAEFYARHMMKIASRIEAFLRNGSSLRFERFKHIHIAVTVVAPRQT